MLECSEFDYMLTFTYELYAFVGFHVVNFLFPLKELPLAFFVRQVEW